MHNCLYCYAREAIYSNYSPDTLIYSNLPELVEKDLRRMNLCPPISLSNVSDPCQDIPELKAEVERLVQVLLDYGVSFAITTKGDPSFLLELPGFTSYEPKLIAITIEGTEDMLPLLSPGAPPFALRLLAITRLSQLGIKTVIRFDPVFIHLFQALYGDSWFAEIDRLISAFAASGARHIVASTGRLSKGAYERVFRIIKSQSSKIAEEFSREYVHGSGWMGQGYRLRYDLRLAFHHKVRAIVEARGLTYATCQELPASEDSPGIPHCEGIALPFTRKERDKFSPIPGCTANCHVSCHGISNPPCGRPELATPRPLKLSQLR